MRNFRGRHLLILCSTLVCLAYLTYRVAFTMRYNTVYTFSASWMLWICEAYGVLVLLLYYFQVWTPYEPPEQPVLEGRTVDVFVPTYNEDLSILRATLEACSRMTYPHRTYLCDDGGTDARCAEPTDPSAEDYADKMQRSIDMRKRRADLQELCAELGAHYLTRPKNEHAKAGNLNHAFEQTDGEFLIIFDADHVPEPHFISRLIGYFADEKLGYIQTPHAFYNFDNFQAQLNHKKRVYWEEGQLFYQVIQPGRNLWGAPIFAGSAAMFRRTAMREVGWIATETITEDMHTGMRINSKGYRSMAISERMVAGQAAPDVTTFHTQRLRWGEGNLSIMAYDNPLTMRGLTLGQRCAYFGSMVHWAGGLFKLGIYITPILMLFTGEPPVAEFDFFMLMITAFYMVITITITRVISNGNGSFYNSEFFSMVNFWTQIRGTFKALFWRKFQQFVVTSKRGRQSTSIWPFVRPQAFLLVISVLALVWGWGKLTLGLSDDWKKPLLPSCWIIFHMYLAYEVIRRGFWPKDGRFSFRHMVHLPVVYERLTAEDSKSGTPQPAGFGITTDLSESGLALIAYEQMPVGSMIRMTVRGGGETLTVQGEVRSAIQLNRPGIPGRGGYRHGICFQELAPLELDAVNRICLHYAVPRLYDEYTAFSKVPLNTQVERALGLSERPKRADARLEHHLPVALLPDDTDESVHHAVTEDLSGKAFAVILEEQLLPGSERPFVMGTPLGEVRGQARVVRNIPRRWAARSYWLSVFEFESFEADGRELMEQLTNPRRSSWLDPVLRPQRRKTSVSMARLIPVAGVLFGPLIALAAGLFLFAYNDDLFLAWADKQPSLTVEQQERVHQIYASTIVQPYPDMDRLVLLNSVLNKNEDERFRSDELTILLAQRDRSNLRLQVAAIAASDNTRRFIEAEAEYKRLLERSNNRLSPMERRELDLAIARVAAHAGKLEESITRFQALLDSTPDDLKLRNELAGALIAAVRLPDVEKLYSGIELDTDAKLLLATALAQRGQQARATDIVKAILKAEPRNEKAKELLSDIVLAGTKGELARREYEELRRTGVINPKMRLRLAHLALNGLAYRDAVERFGQMLAEGQYSPEVQRGFIDSAAFLTEKLSPEMLEQARNLTQPKKVGAGLDPRYLARLAWVLQQNDDLDDSLGVLNRAMAGADPTSAEAIRTQLVGLLVKMNRWDEARTLLVNAGRLADAKQIEASQAMQEKRYAHAETACRELIELRSGTPGGAVDGRRLLAEVMLLKEPRDFDGSIRELGEALKAEKKAEERRLIEVRTAEVMLWKGDYPAALEKYEQLLQPPHRDERNLWPGLIDSASGAINTQPLTPSQLVLARYLAGQVKGYVDTPFTALSRLAWVLYKSNDRKGEPADPTLKTEIESLLDTAIGRILTHTLADDEDRDRFHKAAHELGGVLAAVGRYGKAVEMLERADLKGEARLQLARAYIEVGRIKDAGIIVDELAADPKLAGDRELQLVRVSILTHTEPEEPNKKKALALLRKLQAENKNDRETNLQLANLALEVKQYDVALVAFERLLKDNPDQPDLWPGFIGAAASANKDAIKTIRKTLLAIDKQALATHRDDRDFLRGLAWVLKRAGELNRSVPVLRRVLEINPNDAETRLALGYTYLDLNQERLAQAEFDRIKQTRRRMPR